jgi:hypothetical protein
MVMTVLKQDGRRHGLIEDWDRWLSKADKLYERFLDQVGVSPFYFNEVASSGFLASAAAVAGFVPLSEYEIDKRSKVDRRVKVHGRADLWFSSRKRAYSFELKRAWLSATVVNLTTVLQEAVKDIKCIPKGEYHYAAAGLITRVRDAGRKSTYEAFAESGDVDLAYRIGPDGEDGAYLFFKLAP